MEEKKVVRQELLELGCELVHRDGQWSLDGKTKNCRTEIDEQHGTK